MTYEFAVKEATRRTLVLKTMHYVVYASGGYMVLGRPLTDREEDKYATVDVIPYTEEMAVSWQHEEILAGLANERPHSRFKTATGGSDVRWTYDGHGNMIR